MIVEVISLVSALVVLAAAVRAHRAASKKYPPLQYSGRAPVTRTPWRWKRPRKSLGLRVENRKGVSVLHVPYSVDITEKLMNLLGYAALLASPPMAIQIWLNGLPLGLIMVAVIALLGWAMIHIGAAPVRIELRPDAAHLVLRYGLVLLRRRRYRPGRLRVRGKMESILEKAHDREPRFKIFLRGGLFEKRYVLSCNQSQGSWIVGGLQHWNNVAGPGTSGQSTSGSGTSGPGKSSPGKSSPGKSGQRKSGQRKSGKRRRR